MTQLIKERYLLHNSVQVTQVFSISFQRMNFI